MRLSIRMTDLEDNAAIMALEYLRDYCHRRQCGEKCSLTKLCRIVWNDGGWDTLENAVDYFIK